MNGVNLKPQSYYQIQKKYIIYFNNITRKKVQAPLKRISQTRTQTKYSDNRNIRVKICSEVTNSAGQYTPKSSSQQQ